MRPARAPGRAGGDRYSKKIKSETGEACAAPNHYPASKRGWANNCAQTLRRRRTGSHCSHNTQVLIFGRAAMRAARVSGHRLATSRVQM
eukprot:5580471-Prymnesium_polylepis.1